MLGVARPEKVIIICPDCGRSGSAILSERQAEQDWLSTAGLTALSEEFHFRSPQNTGPLDVVCSHCGAVLA